MLEVRLQTGRGIFDGIRAETDQHLQATIGGLSTCHGTCQGKTDLRVAQQCFFSGACSSSWCSSRGLRRQSDRQLECSAYDADTKYPAKLDITA